MSQSIMGRRIFTDNFAPGDFGKIDGVWYARPPDKDIHLGSLEDHGVVEHDDGTITVTPSILITQDHAEGQRIWHGYLIHGSWRACE